jgi:ribosome-binding ATPase YchF (GTP1/OBG family)
MQAHLAGGHLASSLPTSAKECEIVDSLFLLTSKPRLYVANVSEDSLPGGGRLAEAVCEHAVREGAQAIVTCAQLEADLADWSPAEASEYRAELGMKASGLEQLVHAGYQLLNLITFFTATGTAVVRAWTLELGQTAYDAAGKVHTDMQRGFIRAEVVSYSNLMSAGNFATARQQGVIRLEGKEYPVQDGDVLHIRFSPPR